MLSLNIARCQRLFFRICALCPLRYTESISLRSKLPLRKNFSLPSKHMPQASSRLGILYPNQRFAKPGTTEKKDYQTFGVEFLFKWVLGCRRYTLCISRRPRGQLSKKGPPKGDYRFLSLSPNKKGAGRTLSPRINTHFAVSDAVVDTHALRQLRRQNLAALCTATGKNLTAVGSSHSLAETVHLGSVATAGLIGTLHLCTPPVNSHMLDSHKTAAEHNYGLYHSPAHYNLKNSAGQEYF